MKREELDKVDKEEFLNREARKCLELNQLQMASSQSNLDHDDEGNGDNEDKVDDNEDCISNDEDDYDLPDLGSAQDYEVSINAIEGTVKVCHGSIEHDLLKRNKNINQDTRIQPAADIFSTSPDIPKRNELSMVVHEPYTPNKCPKASDVNYSPTPKSLLHSNEPEKSNVTDSEEIDDSSLEGTHDSTLSPDTRRSQRIKSKKRHKRNSSCSCCENSNPNSPRKIKRKPFNAKSKDSPIKNNDLTSTTDVVKKSIEFSSNMKGKGKKKNEKSSDKIKTGILDPIISQEMSYENMNESNKVCTNDKFDWGPFENTQALLDSELPDEWESDSTIVKLNAATKKAQAEFEKIRKNFKSRKKKQNTDMTMFMDSCQVSKIAKEVKPMHRKAIVNRNKAKNVDLPKNQSKINTWITKGSKQANPSVNEEPKASGSRDYVNDLCENDLSYKQNISKKKKDYPKGMKSTKDTKCNDFDLHSEPTFEPLTNIASELDENMDYSPVPSVGDDSRLYPCSPSEQLDMSQASLLITHEELVPNQAERASSIAQKLEAISCDELEKLVTDHLPFLDRVARGHEDIERHTIYMEGGAAARLNTPEVIFAPFTDEQLEHVHSVLRSKFLKKLEKNGVEGKEYLWMVLVPTFLIRLVMNMEKVSFEDAELLFKHMAFPKRPSRDSLGLGNWD